MALIVQLLNFSSVEASAKDLNAEDFNFQDFVNTILLQFRAKAEEKGLALICRIAEDIPAVLHGDHVVLQQIFSNIIENALKYTERGGIVCEATLKEAPQDGVLMLQISIQDSGCSIPPEKQKVIFDSFTQAEEYTTRRYQGAGLGLTVAAKLVELMGGTIWLNSMKGKGTTFFFTVRLHVAGS
jgi:signal transduction histidine kinase